MISFSLSLRNITHYSLALAVLAALLLGLSASRPAAADDGPKVVYHADFADPRRFSAMLTSINNMMNYYENELIEADVRIVFVAHGIRFVTDDKLAGTAFEEDKDYKERRENLKGRLMSLVDVRGVQLELCDITRSEIQLAEDKLHPKVKLVTSGVVRIAELQSQGFAYIKIE